MAGIYIHIPFCKKRCTYCDFYTQVAPQLLPKLTTALIQELHLRKEYLENASIDTIYFGGGTPSILSYEQFNRLFEVIFKLYKVSSTAEITFEANPDDLTEAYFSSLASLPFNRISIGIQSFDDKELKAINRRHSGKEAIQALKNAQHAGFKNISIDLIYGLPNQTIEKWAEQLNIALGLNIQHLSAYGLTYEEGTELWKQKEKGTITPTDDETMNDMYKLLVQKTAEHNFEAYEISNFSLPGYRSRHNTSYWKQQPYLGIGPSAHSYNIRSRQWNIASITDYISAIQNNQDYSETEILSLNEQYNDYVMVSLRTSDGIDIALVEHLFGIELKLYLLTNIQSFIDKLYVTESNNMLRLTPSGIEISNIIIIELLKV